MRKFYLTTGSTTFDLNGGKYMFTSPTGLGATFTNTILPYGDGFGAMVRKEQKCGQIVGKLNFFADGAKTPYEVYQEFADVLARTEREIYFCYQPFSTVYKAKVEVAYLTKTESYQDLFLEIPVAFDMKTLWFTEETKQTVNGEVEFERGGQMEMGVRIETSSLLSKPTIKIQHTTGQRAVVTDLKADFTGVAKAGYAYSNEPDYSIFKQFYQQDSLGDDYMRFITNIDTPELIYGRPKYNFKVTLYDEGDDVAMNGTVTCYRYWRTV